MNETNEAQDFPVASEQESGSKQQLRMKGTNWTIVTIPPELVEILRSHGKRFLKIEKPILGEHKSGKAAFEKKWFDKLYAADDPELLRWLAEGGNYGIACSDGIAEVDMDIEALQNKFEAEVNTFTVQSGRISNVGKHALITTDARSNGSINDGDTNLGNIQIIHKYVVGPNCNHFSGNKYKIIRNVPMAYVSKKKLN